MSRLPSYPRPDPAPGIGEAVGVDRGAIVSAALSTGELLAVPPLSPARQRRLRYLQRKLARARRGSHRRAQRGFPSQNSTLAIKMAAKDWGREDLH